MIMKTMFSYRGIRQFRGVKSGRILAGNGETFATQLTRHFTVRSVPCFQFVDSIMTAVPASASDLSRYSNAKDHVAMFQKILGEHNVVSDSFDMEKYCYDWKRNYFGGSLVVTPVRSDQVQEVMRYCSAHQIGVVVQGGNTGLVGGAVGTNRGELVLSMEKMNKVISIDADSATVICEAGCILENLNSAVEEHGFMIPLDLGPKGSCQIGGNISTNAGGLRVVRYGSLQTNVLGLEVIQANGDKLDMLRTLYKDNTGYHLKHLFIGAEGTLGVVTKIALRLAVTPKSSAVVFSKIPNFQAIPQVLRIARAVLGANLSAFEFIDSRTISAIRQAAPHLLHRVADTVLPEPDHDVLQKHPELKVTPSNPEFGIPGEVSLLVEATGTDPETDSMKLEKFVSSIMEENLVIDAVMAQDKTQETGLWLVREQCAVALIDLSRRIIPFHDPKDNSGVHSKLEKVWCGYLFKFDLSLSLTAMPQVLQETMLALQAMGFHVLPAALHESSVVEKNHLYATKLEFCNYGHVGDQNVHLNILMQTPCVVHEEKNVSASHSTESAKNFEVISPMGINSDNAVMQFSDYAHAVHHVIDDILYAAVLRQRGSVSAEHGIGQEKKAALAMARSGPELMLMQAIKKSLDPNNILNPGKML